VGITEKSKVSCRAELEQQAAYFIETFGGALIEEFIDGREFSCLVCSNPKSDQVRMLSCVHACAYRHSQDPILFHPVECVWEPHLNFKTFAYKWSGGTHELAWALFSQELGSQESLDEGGGRYVGGAPEADDQATLHRYAWVS
jgi:hypothetical protein